MFKNQTDQHPTPKANPAVRAQHVTSENLDNKDSTPGFESYDPITTKSAILTNRVPTVIHPDEIATARLLIRRDRTIHYEEVGETLRKLRKTSRASDCTVICGKTKFPAHRVVLAAHSQYFGDFLYETADSTTVDIPADGVLPDALEILLKYMYSGKLTVTFDTVMDLLNTAKLLGLQHKVVVTCKNFLDLLLAEDNLMNTLQLAENQKINGLYLEAYRKLARNFYSQTRVPAFLKWTIDKVCSLLSNDSLIIESELHVFTAAMRWIEHNRPGRIKYLKRLMDTVRWMYMTQEEIMQCVDQERQLLDNDEVRPSLIEATWYKTFKTFDFAWKDYPIPPPRIKSLRNEDPNDVVQRIRTELTDQHSSFDKIRGKYRPMSDFSKLRPLTSLVNEFALPGRDVQTPEVQKTLPLTEDKRAKRKSAP